MYVLGLILSIGAVTFSAAVPTIIEGSCKFPPRLDHAELAEDGRKEIYSPGQVVHYSCQPGYIRTGAIKMACSEGKWYPISRGHCKKRRCGNPGDIEFGTYELKNEEDFVFGATVEYSCDSGYQMISKHKSIECTATGWPAVRPHCEARLCPALVDDSVRVISTVSDDEYTAGHVIKLECKNRNGKLYGPSQIYCTSNGTWSEDPPTCKAPCTVHNDKMKQHNIRLKNNRMQHIAHVAHNELIVFECIPGYEISDLKTLNTNCNEGVVAYPTCHLKDQLCPPVVQDSIRVLSTILEDEFTAGQVIKLECRNPKYKLDGPSQITCTSTGTWNIDPPTCKGPCKVHNDKMKKRNILLKNNRMQHVAHNEVIQFECVPGYEISDPKTFNTTCNDGVVAYPTCHLRGKKMKKKACLPPPEVKHGESMVEKKEMYDSGSTIQFKCLSYHKLKGKENIKCKDGVWDPLPTCMEPCTLNYNYIKGNNTIVVNAREKYLKHKQTVQFQCLPAFRLSDPKPLKVKCLNGKLKYPKCVKAEPCILNENYITGNNTVVNVTDKYLEQDQIVQFKCLPTFRISDPKLLKVKCLNRTLRYPKCVKAGPCTLNQNVMLKNNITVKSVNTHCGSQRMPNKCGIKSYKVNETIEFSCLSGYEISDHEELKVKCHGGVVEYPICFEKTPDEPTFQPSAETEIY